jgi:hypothetical protein
LATMKQIWICYLYLWRKVVCLFCFVCTYEIHRTGMLQTACLLVSLESSWGCFRSHACWSLWKALVVEYEGCIIDLVSWCLDLWCRSFFEYWMISSLKIKTDIKFDTRLVLPQLVPCYQGLDSWYQAEAL